MRRSSSGTTAEQFDNNPHETAMNDKDKNFHSDLPVAPYDYLWIPKDFHGIHFCVDAVFSSPAGKQIPLWTKAIEEMATLLVARTRAAAALPDAAKQLASRITTPALEDFSPGL